MSYEQRLNAALEKTDAAEIEAVAREAFADAAADEDLLAWISATVYENEVESVFDLVEAFVERFPESLHLGRVYLADLLARADRFDDATDHARVYLRQAEEQGALAGLAQHRIVQDGVARAVLLLTAAYTELGARSYSARALAWAGRLPLTPEWLESIRKERLRLAQELKEQANGAIDAKWEQFFSSGKHADELLRACAERGYPLMAKRLELLEASHRFNAGFKPGEREILMLVHASDANQFVLQ